MRLASVQGRATLLVDEQLVDVERASGGALSSDPMDHFGELEALSALLDAEDSQPAAAVVFDAPVPRPPKVIAIGLNYRKHAIESNMPIPDEPVVFARFSNALCGPTDEIVIPAGCDQVDWEAELVIVMGRGGGGIAAADAWPRVAGLTCGQDVSDRREQMRGMKQFTVAKSYDTFAPIGPHVVSVDEFANPDDLEISCSVDGERVQNSRTGDLIFSVPELVEWVSRHITLEPGDLIFTGTPEGVGMGQDPPRYLCGGMVVETTIEGIGSMRNVCVDG
ncbi:MAG: fumarylacetoacetate hydrolase family protein [Actinomycetia bacterium]|nr:fumarylacetoacetate hydrolase family protein [Actinomycetes bacterium]